MKEQKLRQLGVFMMSAEEMKHTAAAGFIDWIKSVGERGVEDAKKVQKIYKAAGIDIPLKNIMEY